MSEENILVCMRTPPRLMEDNRIGFCSECGSRIQYRPHAPAWRKVCMECALPHMMVDGAEIATTPQMLEDAIEYRRKKNLQ